MSKRQLLCLLGVWVMIFTFLGFPSPGSEIIAVVSGFLIVLISYNLPHEKRTGSFTENNTPTQNS